MSRLPVSLGFIALTDAAPLFIAQDIGFAEAEGIDLTLRRAPSWSTLRDMLALGQVDGAHMLSPVPVAMALGLGGMAARFDALSVLSVNGNVICVSNALAGRMRALGHDFGFADARAAGLALIAAGAQRPDRVLRMGIPFPFSMHAELVYYWLGALGLRVPQDIDVHTVPPPLMAEAMARGEIDLYCVGEPWGSIAVEQGVGTLLLPGSAIWARSPEKVLAVRQGWAEADPDLTARLLRAVWRAGRWLGDPANLTTAAEILARPDYVNVAADVLDRALSGRMLVSASGGERLVPGFMGFFDGAATFPWRSQAAWIGTRLAARMGLNRAASAAAARQVFRSDLYRQHLRDIGAVLPGASEKLEGAVAESTPVSSQTGRLILPPDQFFDGMIFDPAFAG